MTEIQLFMIGFLFAIIYMVSLIALLHALKRECPEAIARMQEKAVIQKQELFCVLNFVLGARGLPNSLSQSTKRLLWLTRLSAVLTLAVAIYFHWKLI